jgi:hypothetical protein
MASVDMPEKNLRVATGLACSLVRAQVLAAGKDLTRAEAVARQALAEAQKAGLVRYQLEASLALAECQAKGKDAAAVSVRLRDLESSARKAGFELIARQAAASKP